MRRWLSVFMILFLGLWPLTGTLQASDDARLPPCCRRHGAHHCAMAMQMAAMMARSASSSTPMLAAPMTCPLFPGFLAGPCTPSHALAASAASLPVLIAQPHSPLSLRANAWLRPIRTHAGRGPPSSTLS
ncbi:MAG TPA: hypothetical protein VMW15_13195 [Terracidiphilus sp.]|nr:hypothetical protein [Terracidiphilus sp.]